MNTAKKSLLGSVSRLVGQYSFIVVFVAIFIVYAFTSSSLTWSGVMNILRHSAVIGILALGMGLICLTGEIDLSVGSMLAIVGGLAVVVFNMTNNILLTLLFALVLGGLLGLINGVLVGVVEMPAFIVTLATMLIYRSIAQYLCQHLPKELCGGGSSVYKMDSGLSSYQTLYGFGNGKAATVPVVGILLILMTVLFVYLSTCTKFGKKVYSIGSNQKAAGMAGINVSLVKTVVFVIAGVLVGAGAFLWIAMNASCDPATTGNSYEMYAIAAVVLGGISMSGGRGKCLGILFGAMSYTIIDKIIVALKMDSLINDAIKGVILIVVILIQVAGPKLKEKFGH
ncbi:MAG: ABC transporter permease [Candidatus Onthomonas sp.]